MKILNYNQKIFYPVPGFNSKYFMCKETQEILSLCKPQYPKILKPCINGNGYYMVGLWAERTQKNINIHRLWCEMFLPNPENKPYINHKDGNKLNNEPENLEWCTAKENTVHAWETSLASNDNQKKEVHQYHPSGYYMASFSSLHEAAEAVGREASNILVAVQESTLAGNSLWSYKQHLQVPPYKLSVVDHYIVNNEIVHSLKEVCKITGMSRGMFHRRLKKFGESFEQYGFKVEVVYLYKSPLGRNT